MAYEDFFRRLASDAAKEARDWADAAAYLGSDVKPEKAAGCWQAAAAALQVYAAAYVAMAARSNYERADALADLVADERHDRRGR